MTEAIEPRLCPECGYNLFGLQSDRCPECGRVIEPGEFISPIPWEHRRQLGHRAAFWRTVRLGMFGGRRLASAVGAPISEPAAREFQTIVVLYAAAGPIAFLLWTIHSMGGSGFLNLLGNQPLGTRTSPLGPAWEGMLLWSAGATHWWVSVAAIVVTLLLWSAVGGYCIGGGEMSEIRRHRARIAGIYLCAPMICLGLLIAVLGAGWQIDKYWPQSDMGVFYAGLGIILSIAIIVIAAIGWWNVVRIGPRALHCGLGRQVVAGILLPVLWMAGSVVGLVILPMILGLIAVMIDSLR